MAHQVHVDHFRPVFRVDAEDHSVAQDSRVVDQDVQSPKGIECLANHVLGTVGVGDVVEVGHRLPPASTIS